MKTSTVTKRFTFLLAGLFITSLIWAQGDPSKRPSPPATATGQIKGGATITINYSSPGVKGRKIFGGLVPYGKVWRAGANEATLIQTDKDILVEGKPLPAGKYSLYLIPGETQWTVIINSQTGQWGITRAGETTEDPAKDVVRVMVKPVATPALTESLVYEITKKGFVIRWENVEVPVSVK